MVWPASFNNVKIVSGVNEGNVKGTDRIVSLHTLKRSKRRCTVNITREKQGQQIMKDKKVGDIGTHPLPKIIALLACFLFIIGGCSLTPTNPGGTYLSPIPSATRTPSSPIILSPLPTTPPLSDSELAHNIVQGMSLDQKLGQMVIVEFYGPTLNSDLIQMVQNNRVSGVLIENKNGNAQTRDQLIALNKAMQGQAHIPLFITTDFEGGLVNELRHITGERPSEATIGTTGNPQAAYTAGRNAATNLTSLGLNVNFMPIVDVLTNPNNPGLPDRTFGSDPTLVTNMGRAYLKGLTDGGVIGCLKHFPGLGSASIDPHFSLPQMNRSLA